MKDTELNGTEEMEDEKELSFTDIVALLIQSDEHINLKTRITQPKNITGLHILKSELKGKFLDANKPIKTFLKYYKQLVVSHMGLGRQEVVKALQSVLEHERERVSLGVKLKENVI